MQHFTIQWRTSTAINSLHERMQHAIKPHCIRYVQVLVGCPWHIWNYWKTLKWPLVVTGKKNVSWPHCFVSTSVWVKKTLAFQDLLTEGLCVYVCARRLMVRVKIIRRLVPIVFVPVASLLGSLGSPCSLSHDDLHRTYIHTHWRQLPGDHQFTKDFPKTPDLWNWSRSFGFTLKYKTLQK